MALKRREVDYKHGEQFESDVISDGTQTSSRLRPMLLSFESDVISDGTQTARG